MDWLAVNQIWLAILAAVFAAIGICFFIPAIQLLLRSSNKYFEVHEVYPDENYQKLTYLQLNTLKIFKLLLWACSFLASASILLGAYKQSDFYIYFGIGVFVLSLFLWIQEKKYINTLRKELYREEPQ